MRRYLRLYRPGGTYFLTVVTFDRNRILTTDLGRQSLRTAIHTIREQKPFSIVAIVLLPDHFHVVISLPTHDADFSTRIRLIKSRFTQLWMAQGGHEAARNESRRRKGERAIWQRRFYEHAVRDDEDLERCCDYIHWNPVKHQLVSRVRDYPWSSFHRFVRLGQYDINWGGSIESLSFDHPD